MAGLAVPRKIIEPYKISLNGEQEEIFNVYKSGVDNVSQFSFTIYQPFDSDFFDYIRKGGTKIHLYLSDKSDEFLDLTIINDPRPKPISWMYSYPDNFMELTFECVSNKLK